MTGHLLADDVAAMLAAADAQGLVPLDRAGLEGARRRSAAGIVRATDPVALARIREIGLEGPAGPIPARVYTPPVPRAGRPAVVYLHGGGWLLGAYDGDDSLCLELAERVDATVISVGYRRAPEHRFPAAVEDAVAMVRAVAARGPVAVAGWSAGANLAAAASRLLADEGRSPIIGQLLLNPVADGSRESASFARNAEGYGLTRDLMRWFWNEYVPDPGRRRDPRASPLLADRFTGLPPAVVVTSWFDPLHDEGVAYARALQDAGVEVVHIDAPDQTHSSVKTVAIASAAVARAEALAAFRRILDGVRPLFDRE